MELSSSKKWWFYLGTLAIELVTGVFRLLFTIPLVLLVLVVLELILGKLGIQLFDSYRAYGDLQYSQQVLWFILIAAAMLAYANIIASVVAIAGFGGGSLMTRFVLGARQPSIRERETILQVFEQMVEGADFPLRSYSKLYVIDSVLDFANLIGTTLYVSSASFRGNNLQALVAHEFGHLNNGDGSLILALRRLVFPPFSLFIGGIRDFSTNRPAYRPGVKEFDAIQIFYSMINNIIFFTLAFIGGGIGVWVMSWAWASYFRARDYLADSFAAGLGYRDLLLGYLEANIYFDTSIPYMLGWHPAAELRIDALQHPGVYGLPVYDDVPAAAEAGAAFASLAEVEPTTERATRGSQVGDQKPSSNHMLRNIAAIAIILVAAYILFRAWPSIWAKAEESTQQVSSMFTEAWTDIDGLFTNTSTLSGPADIPAEGLTECPDIGATGSGEETNWQISVPDGELAFISTQSFDEQEGQVFVTITGPYEGVHKVKDATYCGKIPADADYAAVRAQYLGLLKPPYQQVQLPLPVDPEVAIEISPEPYDCLATTAASRELKQHGSGMSCWLQLVDGAPAELEFNDEVQVTYRTASGGDDVYFYVATAGEELKDVIGATIRPMPFVRATYGGLEEVKNFEVAYHSPGGQWVACLRDASNYQALNSECGKKDAGEVVTKSRAEALVEYDSIFIEQGWCSLWGRLIDDGLVKGNCPQTVLQWGDEDIATANGTAKLVTGLQMRATEDTEIYYPACATFGTANYTGGTVEPWIHDDYIATDIVLHPDSLFSVFFRCDNAWSPPVEEPDEAASLDSLIGADVLAQIQKLGYSTAADFAKAWGLRIGPDQVNGEVDPGEILTCPGEVNGCVRITREKNTNGAVEFAFYAKNPNSCEHNGYRRVPGEGAQTGVPANFEGMLEGVTIRYCQEAGPSDETEPGPNISLAGWVVCWHGRDGHEFLVAYPEAEVRKGIDLTGKVPPTDWSEPAGDLANDSLKMCYSNGNWYGLSTMKWFPSASFLRMENNQMQVCQDDPCGEIDWTMPPGAVVPNSVAEKMPQVSPTELGMLASWESP